jgi:hypothetical protein
VVEKKKEEKKENKAKGTVEIRIKTSGSIVKVMSRTYELVHRDDRPFSK